MKNIASSSDSIPEHNLETSGSPLARRHAGALNMSKEKNSFLGICFNCLWDIRFLCIESATADGFIIRCNYK